MATRPSIIIDWGTTPTEHAEGTAIDDTKDVIIPSTAYQQAGWTAALGGPVRQFANWALRNVSEWLLYLRDERDDHETRLADVEGDALLGVDDRDVADLDAARPYWLQHQTAQPGAVLSARHIATHDVVAVCSDGEWVWVALSNGDVTRYSAASLTLDGTWSWSAPSGTIRAIACAGADVYVAADATMYQVDRDAATTTNSRTLGGNVLHLAATGVAVYAVVGTVVSRHAITLTAASATYDHGDTVNGIAASHSGVHVVGAAAYTVGLNDYGYVHLDVLLAGVETYYGEATQFMDVACDGKRVFLASQVDVRCVGVTSGLAGAVEASLLWTSSSLGIDVTTVVANGRDAIAYDDTQERVYAIDAATGSVWWHSDGVDASDDVTINVIAADAYGLIVGGSNDATDAELARISDGHDGRLVARRLATDPYRHPYHQLLVPID